MNIIHCKSIDEVILRSAQIKQSVSESGSAIIRGLVDPQILRKAIPQIYDYLKTKEIKGTTAGDRATVRRNSAKWSVGANTGAQIGNARLMITIYNPLQDIDTFGCRIAFRQMIDVRDAIRNDSKSTRDEHLSEGAFNACRFQIYPEGGGFMLGHTDYVAEGTALTQRVPLLQLLLFITQRKVDFEDGGAYLIHNGQTIDVESFAETGDIAIYDGNSFHGVADIDPHLALNSANPRGRIVGLVTIYN
jgi:hypothetical protein